ncbi:RNA polymerase sigma factor [Pseudomarimonas salicorniae]|uniref:Sigma-70 family RNA polymerase sigma factor n=1 Tax=Pseudomarimonas salicorniae TaxID=2933270 RepID=A0ABT0GCY6_9GAMM|nr:sigma-70 family RNA polymerase sigma factor [Lysobacter sp. CAU 1642]MCK7592049.1 sigma-70 family RNA polymerase sigma factor [Lysobacter sp. CAU 1642]
MLLGRLLEQVLRREGAGLRAALMRLGGDLDAAEDALQEACLRALQRWPDEGLPERPAAWLLTVARRLLIDRMRRRRELPLEDDHAATLRDPGPCPAGELEQGTSPGGAVDDDRLRLLFQVCHPALAPEASMALALKVVCGLSTREIGRAFLLGDTAAAQRIVRAKQKIRQSAIPFALPRAADLPLRVEAVLKVIYLLFNEGYAATEGEALIRPDLCREAIRLAELACALLPGVAEAWGLLALLHLTDARRPARLGADGALKLLDEQDRKQWDRAAITAGEQALQTALALHQPGPYQVQAAIAALHAEAATPGDTDWAQILALYRRLLQLQPGPVVELNAAVALGMARGPAAGLAWLDRLEAGGLLEGYHLLPASRSALLQRLGREDEALAACETALTQVRNDDERRLLQARRAELMAKRLQTG